MSNDVVTFKGDTSVLSEELFDVVVQNAPSTVVVEVARQGPPGPQGPAGGSTMQLTAGATLSALVVVYEEDGSVFALGKDDDANIDQLLGLTVTAADAGNQITVQRLGSVDNSGWAWTAGRVYLGAGGALTQTPASTGNDVLIGRAVSATRLLLDLQDPIDLEG